VGEALEGKWSTGQSWWGVKEGAIDMVSVAADVPEDAKKKVDEIKAESTTFSCELACNCTKRAFKLYFAHTICAHVKSIPDTSGR